jgi:hypothetical protein
MCVNANGTEFSGELQYHSEGARYDDWRSVDTSTCNRMLS